MREVPQPVDHWQPELPERTEEGHHVTEERTCIRGCTVRDVHYATCPSFGTDEGDCKGCAPRVARHGALICDRCYGRTRRLLAETPELIERIRSIADPTKAVVYSAVRAAGARDEKHAPTPSDVLDATTQITSNMRDWAMYLDPGPFWNAGSTPGVGPVRLPGVATTTRIIAEHLDELVNDRDQILRLSEAVLVNHSTTDEGVRETWSVADAAARWGLERRTKETDWVEDEIEELVTDIPEWDDPVITLADAAKKVRKNERALQRWVKNGDLDLVARTRGPRGSQIAWVRTSTVLRVNDDMESRRKTRPEEADIA